jgi:serine/threonine-protein kinase
MGTPAYISPEMAAGRIRNLGPACDVFSLGATLYCILTDKPPFQSEDSNDPMRKAKACDFPLPITINPHVPMALQAVCCRAMQLDPQQRYGTALELAADVERWLGDEPVTAYREPIVERAFRWMRRHRAWAQAGVISVCIIAIVLMIATWLVNHARREAVALADANAQLAHREASARAEAIKRFAESRQTVDRWLTGFTEAVEYYPGVGPFRERMLSQAADDYSRFAKEQSDDPGLELERGRTLMRLGDLQRFLYRAEAAQQSYADAAVIFSALQSRAGAGADPTLEGANVKLRQGLLAVDVGDNDAAKSHYTEALKELDALAAREVDQQRLAQSLVDARVAYGNILADVGDREEAESQFRLAVEKQSALVRATPTNLALVGPLADVQVRLGQMLLLRGEQAGALAEFKRASGHWDRLVDLEPDHPKPRLSRAAAQIYMAGALRGGGEFEKAARAYQSAIDDYDALIKAIPDDPSYQENRALTQIDLAQLKISYGEPQSAIDLLATARDVLAALANRYRDFIRFQNEHAVCLDCLGEAQMELNKLPDALASFEGAEKTFVELAKSSPQVGEFLERCAIARSHIGQVQAAQGDWENSLKSLAQSIETLEQARILNPRQTSTLAVLATVLGRRGDVLTGSGQTEEAKQAYVQADATWQETIKTSPAAEHLHQAAAFMVLCPRFAALDGSRTLEYAERAVKAAPDNAFYKTTHGAALVRAKKATEAIDILEASSKLEGGDRGRALLFLALCQQQLGNSAEARRRLQGAKAWLASHRPGNAQLEMLASEIEELPGVKH